ncbi:transcription termination/antitermination factor NusG [candidate division KSB1 bacterium]|nr:transcription termination/antitermination factor NusG [bacterium]OQX57695.1 MAG: transcription termination/antitermination factor NusG [candidate division KSB1 bacterium 4484_219]RKY77316.1 MAG: transcription termination/antitermination factor NusG [candidate division KSB1 bacterium]HDI52136.1 transcription termination/antitermination factor NusG [Bacteroidota bacterium]RKY77421.1 MAG: transcription termination/antitermination factor NusG [candidate division KSB1 bacterium]
MTQKNDVEKKWYVVHVLSGHENKVKTYLESEIKNSEFANDFGQVLVPSEEVIEMKEGKRRVKSRVFFPGYILVEMNMTKELQRLIRNIPGVSGFLGSKDNPQPLRDEEVKRILGRVEASKERKSLAVPFKVGDPIRVIDGPFTDFTGFVEEVNEEKNKLKVMVSIFGRATPLELDFLQVELEK